MKEYNLHKFYIGESFDAWKYFGAHLEKNTCVFRVYAPDAARVLLIGEFSDWDPVEMKELEESGVYEVRDKRAKAGDLYKYRIFFEDGNYCDHSDPFGFATELRPNSASIITAFDYKFHDKKWLEKRTIGYEDPINIYEIHLGSWRTKEDGKAYTYNEIAEPLIDYLKEHHYNYVEFMPLTEYPADESWGYQTLGYYSPTSRYGKPEELMELVDKLHQAGIGVIMDFVPVHFALDYYGLARFDGQALFEYPSSDTGYSEWGSCNFNFYRGEVCSFLQSAAAFWIDVYHFDGLRMDAISNAIYWQGNKDRGENEGAIEFIKRMNMGLAERYPTALKIAEDSSDFPNVTLSPAAGGLGFDYKWDMGWMNDTLEFFKFDKYDRGGFIDKIKWSMFYFYNENFILPFSHDEVVHGKGSILNKLSGSYEDRFLQIRLLYLYMMTHPGKKLNFMGNDFAHYDEWTEKHELDWSLLAYPAHQGFLDYTTGLNALYLNTPALYSEDYDYENYRWLDTSRLEVIAYERKAGDQRIIAVLNFGGSDLDEVRIDYDLEANFKTLYSTLGFADDANAVKPEYGGFKVSLYAFEGVLFEVEEIKHEPEERESHSEKVKE